MLLKRWTVRNVCELAKVLRGLEGSCLLEADGVALDCELSVDPSGKRKLVLFPSSEVEEVELVQGQRC